MAAAGLALTETTDILRPTSEDDAIEAFGDGTDVVVVGGGTIVIPELTYRRLRPTRALLLKDAGLAGITKDGSRVTIGAMTPIADLEALPVLIGPCATNIADLETAERRRSAGTCAPARATRRRAASLQGPSSPSARRCDLRVRRYQR